MTKLDEKPDPPTFDALNTDSPSSVVLWLIPCASLFVIGYLFSSWLLEIYTGGDQQYYRSFWNAMLWSKPEYWQTLQARHLGSSDYLYSAIIALGTASGLDRIVYISLWNALLSASICYVLIKYKASAIFSILIFTNYYLLVLFFSAERVKFAYIFLCLAMCVDSQKSKLALSVMGAFCHTQAIVQFASSAIYIVTSQYKNLANVRGTRFFLVAIAPPILLISAYYIFSIAGDVILSKSYFYANQSQGFVEIIQWALLLIAGLVTFNKKIPFLISMIPLGFMTFVYGNRINIATLALFVALSLSQKKTWNPLVLAVMAYMSFKSLDFVKKILETGQGFL